MYYFISKLKLLCTLPYLLGCEEIAHGYLGVEICLMLLLYDFYMRQSLILKYLI